MFYRPRFVTLTDFSFSQNNSSRPRDPSSNDMSDSDYETTSAERIVGGCFTLLFAFFSIFGNLAAMYTISSSRQLHTPPMTLLFFLASADFLLGFIHMLPVSIAWFIDGWPGGPSAMWGESSHNALNMTVVEAGRVSWCGVSSLFIDILRNISLATTVVICLERCAALYFPFKYKRLAKVRSVSVICVCAWFISFLFDIPLFMHYIGARYWEPLGQCVPEFLTTKELYEVLKTKLAFKLICLLIIIVTCYCTITVVLKHSKRIVNMTKGRVRKANQQRTQYATITQLLVVFLSLITWLPHFLFLYMRIYSKTIQQFVIDNEIMRRLRIIVWYFFYLGAVLNPAIYSFRLRTVRVAAKKRLSMAAVSIDSFVSDRFRKVDMAIVGDAAKWKRSGSNSFIWGSVNVSGGSHGSLGTLQSQGV
ncbi:hypothetical protein ACHWQZ_G001354 [Mnemiopsis leidyi]